MKRELLFLAAAFLVSGCGGSSSEKSSVVPPSGFVGENSSFNDSFSFQSINNNPDFSKSWFLYPSTSNRDINATSVWEEGYTGKDIKVGIIDYGFDIAHEDLKNGYFYQVNADDLANPKDVTFDGHGTFCAGIIGARNNSRGSIGVAPTSKLILIQSALDGSSTTSSQTIAALTKAKELKVDVLNNSWGSYQVDDSVRDTIDNLATTGRDGKGMVVIFASGNDGCDLDEFCDGIVPQDESEIESVIGVGSSTRLDEVADFSNYGSNLDIVAPGVDIFSTGDTDASLANNYVYSYSDGTSFSAPVVAGVAALILDANPNLTLEEFKEVLYSGAKKIGDAGGYGSNGHSEYFGYGKVDAMGSLEYLKNEFGVKQ